jgi:hypothetical protein
LTSIHGEKSSFVKRVKKLTKLTETNEHNCCRNGDRGYTSCKPEPMDEARGALERRDASL